MDDISLRDNQTNMDSLNGFASLLSFLEGEVVLDSYRQFNFNSLHEILSSDLFRLYIKQTIHFMERIFSEGAIDINGTRYNKNDIHSRLRNFGNIRKHDVQKTAVIEYIRKNLGSSFHKDCREEFLNAGDENKLAKHYIDDCNDFDFHTILERIQENGKRSANTYQGRTQKGLALNNESLNSELEKLGFAVLCKLEYFDGSRLSPEQSPWFLLLKTIAIRHYSNKHIASISKPIDAKTSTKKRNTPAQDRAQTAKYVEIKEENTELKKHNKSLIKSAEKAIDTANEKDKQIVALKDKSETDKSAINDLSHGNKQLTVQIGELNQSIKLLKSQLNNKDNDISNEKSFNEELKGKIKELTNTITELESDIVSNAEENKKLHEKIDSTPTGLTAARTIINEEFNKLRDISHVTQPAIHKKNEDKKRKALREIRRLLKDESLRDLYTDESDKIATIPETNSKETKAAIKFTSLGGGDEIGASCYLLEIGSEKVMIDCGIRIKSDYGKNAWDYTKGFEQIAPVIDLSPENPLVKNIVITHAHTDHIGWLPALINAWPDDLTVFCTEETKNIMRTMLEDSVIHINEQMARCYLRHEIDRSALIPEFYPYDQKDIDKLMYRVKTIKFGEFANLPGSQLRFKFLRAGHILGAASIYFQHRNRNVLVSGDCSDDIQRTVHPLGWPIEGELDLFVTESTYPKEGVSRKDKEEDFVKDIKYWLDTKSTVLIPAFALGRAQEVIKIISEAFDNGILKPCTVWIDGMIKQINEVYETSGLNEIPFKLNPEYFHYVKPDYKPKEVIDSIKGQPTIIISTAGMMTGGPILEYAERLLPNSKTYLCLVGYQAEDTPGNEIMKLDSPYAQDRDWRIRDTDSESQHEYKIIRVKNPAKNYRLSAHVDVKGVTKEIKRLKPSKIVLVHGTKEGQAEIREYFKKNKINNVEPGPDIIMPEER